MRQGLEPLGAIPRHWNNATDIKTALFARADPTSLSSLAEQARGVRSALLHLPNGDAELESLCNGLNSFAEQADDLARMPEESAASEQLHALFNSILERLYDWADSNDVWLGV
jgi:hypothetical protein